MQRILVIQTAFIGDVVLATGLLEKLHQYYPDAALDILVRKGNESLFDGHPFLHEVLIWNKKSDKYRHLFQLLKSIRQNRYDAVINIQRYFATGFLTAFSGASRKIGFDKNPFRFFFTDIVPHHFSVQADAHHEIQRNHALIRSLTDANAAKPVLYPTAEAFEKVKIYQQRSYICIAPASVWFTKQYPADQWVDLIRQLPDDYTIYLLGAPGDKNLCDQIRLQSGDKATDLSGYLSFLESAALMKNAVMNYVNDSAPMHFASAMNAPVTAVYCSTIPGFGYGPLSDNSHVIQTIEPLSCRPCGLHGHQTCLEKHFKCARTIQTEQLVNSLSS
ncbi:MAG: glycosyltransferase family 9 protein [Sediminibacterium sp.]